MRGAPPVAMELIIGEREETFEAPHGGDGVIHNDESVGAATANVEKVRKSNFMAAIRPPNDR